MTREGAAKLLEMENRRDSLAAIIVAGGYSFRMKSFKPLLRLGASTVLEKAVQSFRDAKLRDIRVVIGYRANELLPVLDRLGVQTIINDNFAEGMFTSVTSGVKSLTPGVRGFFLLPVDNPIIQPDTLEKLMRTFFCQESGIVYPSYRSMRGHPPLISTAYVHNILTWDQPGGLRALLERYQNDTIDVEVADPGILLDMDTPKDYQQMLTYCGYSWIPSAEECYALLKNADTFENVIKHSRQVAWLSCLIGKALNKAGCNMNMDLLNAAGLLHDVAKGQPNHAEAGARMLVHYPGVAEIIASHMDICLSRDQLLTEKEIVYLADKLVQGDRIMPLQERFAAPLKQNMRDQSITQNIKQRLKNAETIQKAIESILKIPVLSLWNSELGGEANG